MIRSFCVAMLFGMFGAASSNAQFTFQQTSGPGGLQIWSIVSNSAGVMLAVTSDNVYRSTNNGKSWSAQFASGTLTFTTPGTAAFDHTGMNAYVSGNEGVYKSSDAGATWFPASTLTASNTNGIAVSSGNSIVVGTFDAGVYRSVDQGASWAQVQNGLPVDINSNTPYPVSQVVAGTNGAMFALSQGGGVARSVDNGASWTSVGGSLLSNFPNSLAVSADGSTDYEVDGNGVFISKDNGSTWTNIANTGGLTTTVGRVVATGAPSNVLVSNQGDVWLSKDQGNSWNHVRSVDAFYDQGNALCLVGNSTYFYVGLYHSGLFASNDTCKTWNPACGGMLNTSVESLAVDSSGVIYAVADANSLYKSDDHGDTWIQLQDPNLSAYNFSSITIASDTILIATAPGAGVFTSSDYGVSWSSITNSLLGVYKNQMIASCSHGAAVFLGGVNGAAYRSPNNGQNWTLINQGISTDTIKSMLTASNGNILAIQTSGVAYSSDLGATWQPATGSPAGITDASTQQASGFIYASAPTGVYYSNNYGSSWSLLPSSPQNCSAIVAAGVIFCSSATTTSYSTDNGSSWKTITPFPFLSAPTFFLQDLKHLVLYAGTVGSGLYRAGASSGPSSVAIEAAPSSAHFGDNYPNPFSASTTIRYSLDAASQVRLDLLDINGKFITTVINQVETAGNYEVSLDAASLHLADGVYICRLDCGGSVIAQCIVHRSF